MDDLCWPKPPGVVHAVCERLLPAPPDDGPPGLHLCSTLHYHAEVPLVPVQTQLSRPAECCSRSTHPESG